jgi:hypothetical protein
MKEGVSSTRTILFCLLILATTASFSLAAVFQSSLLTYDDVAGILPSLSDSIPTALKSDEPGVRRNNWRAWVSQHDREIRGRLLGGDNDTVVNWLLFGTTFTQEPRALFEVSATSADLPRVISSRTKDLIAKVASSDSNERAVFARRLLVGQGFRFDTIEERARLERHLQTEVTRVITEFQQYSLQIEALARTSDTAEDLTVRSRLFHDRGLSLDTSLLPSFAIDQALQAMKRQQLLPLNSIRRIAIIGPGLDFADKNSGYDFYPVQTVQPFTTIDSLLRLGLSQPAAIDVVTLDISERVNEHIAAFRDRAKRSSSYTLRLPIDLGSSFERPLIDYWKSVGDRIGSEVALPKPPAIGKNLQLRGVEVRAQFASRITPVDLNIVTQKWTGQPFDLVIATNILVYYDKLDQSLAFANIEAMLKPGGFFLTNNAVVELPVSRLRSLGFIPVEYSKEPPRTERLFWYRRNR